MPADAPAAAVLATPAMATYCFEVILRRLQKLPIPTCYDGIPNTPCPIFVTLSTGTDKALRGCIGSMAAAPLHEQLRDYALASAFDDSRFDPVRISELPGMTCSVSLLHSYEEAKGWNDWEIGRHGIIARYRHYSATYLPSVMVEQGWDHRQTIESLLAKGRYRGVVDDSVLADVSLTRYQTSSVSVRFEDTKLAISA